MRIVRWLCAGLLAMTLATACSGSSPSGDHGNALITPRPAGTATTSGVHAGVITEVMIPVVANRGTSRLHVLSVRLTEPPAGVHVLETDAYDTSHIPVGIMAPDVEVTGSLSPGNPRFWGPRHPVTAITIAAHGRASWVAVIVFTAAAPGSYHFAGVRITYTIGGARNWQDQSLDDTIRYSASSLGIQHPDTHS
jgi:hypothetical protein